MLLETGAFILTPQCVSDYITYVIILSTSPIKRRDAFCTLRRNLRMCNFGSYCISTYILITLRLLTPIFKNALQQMKAQILSLRKPTQQV